MNNISIGLLFLFGLLMLVNKALNIYQNSYKCEINTFIFYIFLEHLQNWELGTICAFKELLTFQFCRTRKNKMGVRLKSKEKNLCR